MPWGLIFFKSLMILESLLEFLPTIYTLGRVECLVYSVNVARPRPLVAPTKSETWPEMVERRVALDCWTSLRLTIMTISDVYAPYLQHWGGRRQVGVARYDEGGGEDLG